MMETLNYDIIILGGGAAGLMCALTAARRGRRVLVAERANKIGKKILMSGGGRCNFTNYNMDASHFISANPHFCKSALKQFSQWDFIAMVERHSIEYEERKHGQLFCRNSAKHILGMLVAECEAGGVDIITSCELQQLTRIDEQTSTPGSHFQLQFQHQGKLPDYRCSSVVVATGALSIPTLGGSGQGYQIATRFRLPLVEQRPGLVPLMFSGSFQALCERLSGVSVDALVSCGEQSFRESLLFTHRGLSGPVILQISSYWQSGQQISINLLPDQPGATLLLDAKLNSPKLLLKNLLSQHLPKALVSELQQIWWSEESHRCLAEISNTTLQTIGNQLHNWIVKPVATEGYRTAEVTLGGVDTSAISSKTMQATTQPGLFFIGEVLDVSGHLGGYNFQWAWSSAYVAGLHA